MTHGPINIRRLKLHSCVLIGIMQDMTLRKPNNMMPIETLLFVIRVNFVELMALVQRKIQMEHGELKQMTSLGIG